VTALPVPAGQVPGRRLPVARIVFSAMGLGIAVLMVLPLGWLVLRAAEADLPTLRALLLRPRTGQLIANTAALVGGVLALSTAIALPLAWLVSRTDLRGRRVVNLLAVLPLAVPGYVMAYALMGLGGNLRLHEPGLRRTGWPCRRGCGGRRWR
jgi:iron(III) transport system permease protein